MHTVDLLDQALAVAIRLGYRVRQEWLGGEGGGACTLRGQKLLFLDLDRSVPEQLEQVLEAIGRDAALSVEGVPPALIEHISLRRSA
ncbi:MAG: hypothetical protein ACOY3P_16330 [Planctomycetota bacterium]